MSKKTTTKDHNEKVFCAFSVLKVLKESFVYKLSVFLHWT